MGFAHQICHRTYTTFILTIFPLPFHFPMRSTCLNAWRCGSCWPSSITGVVVQDKTVSSTTDLRAVPRASQHAVLCIYLLSAVVQVVTIVAPSESEVS